MNTYTRDDIQPMSFWRHLATDSLYFVLGIGLCSTNGPGEHKEEAVIYWSLSHRGLRYRLLSEFLDGRFEPWDGDKR